MFPFTDLVRDRASNSEYGVYTSEEWEAYYNGEEPEDFVGPNYFWFIVFSNIFLGPFFYSLIVDGDEFLYAIVHQIKYS
jgi:hypothetical protein